MKKPISFLLLAQTLILIATSALMFSSCIIINPDDEVIVERKSKTTVEQPSSTTETPSTPSTPTTPTPPVVTHSITCKNETSFLITDWCVKKDNTVTFANSSMNRSIRPGKEDMIPGLEEGYYVVYFSFEDDYQLDPWDYQSSESIWLNKDVTYCLYERAAVAVACRSADYTPQLYLAGSDGSEIDLICKQPLSDIWYFDW